MRVSRYLFALICALSLLAGCASAPPRGPGTAVDLAALEQWQARGRIGVSSAAGGGSGSFDWRQRKDAADVQIRGPIGIGSVKLKVHGEGPQPEIELQTGDGVKLEAEAAWAELETRLGASLPAGHMRYWLLGLPAPGPHQWLEPREDGSTTLEQQGWRIDYQRYSDESGTKLPTRLRASSGDARVRIIIDRWQLGR